MRIRNFYWDRQNISHIWKHKIDDFEAEEVFINEPVYRRAKNGSYIAFGVTAEGRYLFIVFRKKGKNLIRVSTARDMTKKEKQYYKKKGK